MAYKVYLSPSNQGKNMCALGHSEKQHCEELAQKMSTLLRQRNIEVKIRPNINEMSVWVNEATAWGAQLYIPLHTNATPLHNARGTRFGYYPGRNDSMKACVIFKKNWLKIWPTGVGTVKVGTYKFYEARTPKCPVVYCETVFHDNKKDAVWFHDNLDLIAANFVESIMEFFGINNVDIQPEPKPEPEPEQPKITLPSSIKIQITKPENAKFFGKPIGTIISLPTEEYIKGVVPAEVGNAPLEAGIAQAIAARSILFSGRWSDVITDTTSHQAYSADRGADPAYSKAHQAVKDSKGIVLLYKDKIASCFYTDSNGGKMVASDMHWNQKIPYEQREHIPYLVSKDDPWTLASGKPFNGHPVGMSQQGAIWAAKNGIKHEEILAFYYPGTVLSSKVATTPGTPPVTPPDSKDYLYRAMVVTANPLSLNIWSNTKKGSSLKRVPKGAFVEVLKEVNSTWAQVRYNGTIGYSDRQYLKPHNETGTYLATVVTMYPLSLNIWAGANKGKSLGKVPKGAVVTVLGEVDSTWAKVQYGNIIGYSDRKYLKKV